MTEVRIYADFNGLVESPHLPDRTAVVLDTMGSLRDLANTGIVLSKGLPLIAYDWSDDTEYLEGHGTAQYDPRRKWWVVEFDDAGVRYVPAEDRSEVLEFNCVSCQNSLLDLIKSKGLKIGDSCPRCGTLIHAPLAAPIERSSG